MPQPEQNAKSKKKRKSKSRKKTKRDVAPVAEKMADEATEKAVENIAPSDEQSQPDRVDIQANPQENKTELTVKIFSFILYKLVKIFSGMTWNGID